MGQVNQNGLKEIDNFKLSLCVFGVLFCITALSFTVVSNLFTHADTDVEDTVTITVNSACTLTGSIPSGSEHSATLTPGQNTPNIGITNMTAACNDAAGYDIYAVGYSNNEWKNTDLISVQNNNTYTIATGTATSGDTSNWAMKLAAGTGDAATIVTSPTNYSAYAAVPNDYTKVAYYPSTTAGTGGSSFTTTYQVFTSLTQAAGTYEGKVKYTLIHPHVSDNSNKPEIPIYMQDFTLSQCQAQATDAPLVVYDKRDGSDYTVRYIGGACWMTQNLRITGVISATDSNFTGNDLNISEYSLDSSDSSYLNHCDLTNGNAYNYICSKDSGDDAIGVWYNYAAATAGTITGEGNSNTATEDICPANWHLPIHDSNNPIPPYQSTPVDSINRVSSYGVARFTPVTGGNYTGGTKKNTSSGAWWSSTGDHAARRQCLLYESNSFNGLSDFRYSGQYVRCVRSS